METKITLRLPDEVHRALVAQAAAEHRSLNAQITHLLASAVDAREPTRP
jgi:predicted HicB family RNase H-like nuclease